MVSHGPQLPHAVLVKELETVSWMCVPEKITHVILDIEFEKPDGSPGSYQLTYSREWQHAHPEREPVARIFVNSLRLLLNSLRDKLVGKEANRGNKKS